MDDKHEIYQRVRDLAIELGKTPTINDVSKIGLTKHSINKVFGGMLQLIDACGLDRPRCIPKKINNSIFEKDIEKHLSDHSSVEKIPYLEIKFEKTVIIGDLHFPFTHNEKLKKIIDFIREFKPKHIIQVGDLYDMLSHGKFPRSMNIYTPAQEMGEGHKLAKKMWADILDASPKSQCYQVLGNHDIRPMKRILEAYPEAELFMDFSKWFKFDGVKTFLDTREEVIINGIAFIHGYRGKTGEHMEFMRRPVVCGHLHRPGIVYKNYGDATLFEMNVGYVGDPESKALSYTPQKHTHWSHSFGVIDENGPRIIIL